MLSALITDPILPPSEIYSNGNGTYANGNGTPASGVEESQPFWVVK
jgi:hypothetical protein